MSTQERERGPEPRQPEEAASPTRPHSGERPLEESSAGARALARPLSTLSSGLSVWLLPTATGGGWAVPQAPSPRQFAEQLERPPLLLLVDAAEPVAPECLEQAREGLQRYVRGQFQATGRQFFTRLAIAAALWAVAGLMLGLFGELWVPVIFATAGLSFGVYVLGRDGLGALEWYNRRIEIQRAVKTTRVVAHPLVKKLVCALQLRLSLPAEKRGASPDVELLDVNSYRKLIAAGLTTKPEFCALGRAIDQDLRLHEPDGTLGPPSDVAARTGLDIETILFYRDLTAAALELEFTPD